MPHTTGILVLIAMLATLAGARKPNDLNIIWVQRTRACLRLRRIQHRHRHGRGMHTPALFGGRYPLNPMPASFLFQFFKMFALEGELNRPLSVFQDGVLSTHTVRKTAIRRCQIMHKKLRIAPALGGLDFQISFHHPFLLVKEHSL